jgi:hypothetical protein
VALLAILVGAVDLPRYRFQAFVLLVSPIPFALAASALRQYPFGDRLILFIVPTLIILMVAGVESLRRCSPRGIAGWIALLMLVLPSLSRATGYLFNPPGREETLSAYQWVAAHEQPGDTLYLSCYAEKSFKYYAGRSGINLPAANVFVQPKYEDDPRGFIDDVKKLRGQNRVWVVMVHTINGHQQDEAVFTKMAFDEIGIAEPDLASYPEGAQVVLYDCSTALPAPHATP